MKISTAIARREGSAMAAQEQCEQAEGYRRPAGWLGNGFDSYLADAAGRVKVRDVRFCYRWKR